MKSVSKSNAEHYIWGEVCDGRHLPKRADLRVIQEGLPAGGRESVHYHNIARQIFYILEGTGRMVLESETVTLPKGEVLEIPSQVHHRFQNNSNGAAFPCHFHAQRPQRPSRRGVIFWKAVLSAKP